MMSKFSETWGGLDGEILGKDKRNPAGGRVERRGSQLPGKRRETNGSGVNRSHTLFLKNR